MELWTAFVIGFLGSLHCAGMCGPLALALPQAGSGAGYLAGRLAYNLGRVLTYCLMGLIFGWVGRTLALAGFQQWLSILLGALLLIGAVASRRLALWTPVTALVSRLKRGMSALLRRPGFTGLLTLGLLNGLLPCGLVYVACAGATSTGNWLSGLEYMAAFGIGTVPMMLGISLSGRLVPPAIRLKLVRAVPYAVCVLGALLILRGLALGIPYLSPDLAAQGCCHGPSSAAH